VHKGIGHTLVYEVPYMSARSVGRMDGHPSWEDKVERAPWEQAVTMIYKV
jgi:hypothetical protein